MKITKYFLSMAAAVGMIAGCQEPEMVQMAAPEDVVAPELEAVEGPIEITPSNMVDGVVAFTWSAADYGVQTQINYSLEAATAAAPDTKVTITSGMTGTSTEVDYETLNAILFNDLGLADGVAEDVNFFIGAKVGEYAKIYSNAVTVSCKVTAAEKTYPMVYVIGDFNSWKDGTTQELFEFTPASGIYSGMLGFGGKAANGWKIRGTAEGWDNDCNWGLDGEKETPAAEASELTLISSGGSQDIKIYSKNFYNVTFDKTALTLKVNLSFDQIGVIGSFNEWGADVVMKFDDVKQRFYADVEFAADAEFKFRLDGAWTISYGTGPDGFLTSDNGGNISAKAGNYRVYLNMNNLGEITYELNKGDYGASTPEPEPEPDPTPVVGWSLIGAFNSWAGDLMLTSDGTYYVIKGAELEGDLKFRKDGQWNYKDEEGNEVQTNLGAAEGVTFAADAELALAPNGGNINVTAGTYDVYLDPENAKAWFITDGSYPGGGAAPEASPWALIGDFNSWSADYPMFIEGEYHVAKGFVVAADGGLKFRKDGMWNYKDETGAEIQTNLGGTFAVDAELDVVGNGSNLNVPAGTYDVYLKVAEDGQSGKAYFMTDGKTPADAGVAPEPEPEPTPDPSAVWGVVGTITNWADNSDINMVEEGDWLVAKGVALTTADEFKFRTNGTWGTERTTTSAEPVAINTEYEAAAGLGNIKVAVDGTYDIYLAKTLDKFYVMTAGLTPGQTPEEPKPEEPEFEAVASEWGVVGVVNDWGATADIVMYTTPTEGLFVAKNAEMPDGAFKIRANNAWEDAKNYGFAAAGTAAVDHAYDLICGAGSKDITLLAGTYDIYFDLNNSKVYVMTPGKAITEAEGGIVETPDASNWYLVGNFNGWATGDANYKLTKEGDWYVFKGFVADGQGVKFNAGSWAENRGGTFSGANKAISIAHNGSDMYVTAGTYDVYMNAALDTAYFMEVGKTPAN